MSDTIDVDNWPDCKVPGCTNKSYLRGRSPYCFPHTYGAGRISPAAVQVCVETTPGTFEPEPIPPGGKTVERVSDYRISMVRVN